MTFAIQARYSIFMSYILLTKKSIFYSPGRIIIMALIGTLLLGSFLLWMPFSHHGELSFINALFTATSATCVTGLLTVPLSTFTFTGHCILLLLMQIGGLGLVTLTIFLISLFFELRLTTRHLTGELLELDNWNASHNLLLFIVSMTAVVEAVGTVLIFFTIKDQYPFFTALFYSLFHAISAFTTTGISFFENNQGMMAYDFSLLGITASLVFIGSLGFIVWQELCIYIQSLREKKRFHHWTLHTKIVLSSTAWIIAFTTAMLFYLEYIRNNTQGSFIQAVANSFFNAITCRSAGFITYDIAIIHLATIFLIMIISFIGSSPGSTGSGIKTTTFTLFLAAIRATISRRSTVEMKGRTISNDQIFKAMAVLSLSLSWIAVTVFCLLITEQGWRFIDISFEAFSAFSNLGLSTGITPYLSTIGKLIIIVTMFIGRIGSLTLLLSLKKQKEKKELQYPEERVIIG